MESICLFLLVTDVQQRMRVLSRVCDLDDCNSTNDTVLVCASRF